MEIHNQSPFSALAVPTVCQQDANHLLVAIKGSFDISVAMRTLEISENQAPVTASDEYWGDPASSSLRLASDLVLRKAGTDVAVIGSAVSDKAIAHLNVGILVGKLRSIMQISGRRFWDNSAAGYRMTSAEPFTHMPFVYENAFGGTYQDADSGNTHGDDRNPVGKGIFDPHSYDVSNPPELPNIEFPTELINSWRDRPTPAGSGFVANHWQPRRQYAGTYDSNWEANRLPLLPLDFDDRANNSASPGLHSREGLQGGEPVQLKNFINGESIRFPLPKWTVMAECQAERPLAAQVAMMDTVVVNLDEATVMLTWRTSFPIHWNLAKLQWLKITARQDV